MKKSVLILLSVLLLAGSFGCSKEFRDMNRAVRKGTLVEKDSAAFYFYRRGDYEKASTLFDELVRVYRGQERAKDILYAYAYARHEARDYLTATQHFESFQRLYPTDKRAEECMFMVAYGYYLQSSPAYLDQSSTLKAINQFQFFVNTYPYSRRAEDANTYIVELRERVAQKEFETAELYFNIENYRAAATSFRTFLQEFPDSKYREQAQFMVFKSSYYLASVSIVSKQKNRYLDAIDFYQVFEEKFPTSAYLKEAKDLREKALKAVEKINKEDKDATAS
jgi:outer membrane protein assembly factor BamD